MGYNVVLLSLAGTSYYVASHANELARAEGIDRVRVVVPPWSPETEALDTDVVEFVTIDIAEDLLWAMIDAARPSVLRALFGAVSRGDPDVLHVVNEMRIPPYALSLLRRQCECPVVLTVHEPDPYVPTLLRRMVLNPIQTWNLRLVARSADRYVVHGDVLAAKLARHVSHPEHIAVVPHGSFAESFTDAPPGPPAGHTVLFFGRAAPGKGLPDLVRAAPAVVEAIPDAEFVIAGNGYEPDRFGAIDAPYFTVYDDRVPVETAAALFEQAAVVVMPYENATASGIISIAGGFRRPVVATAVGCFPEVIDHGKTGLLVPPNDPNTLARSLVALLGDSARRERLGAGLHRVQDEQWGWETVVEQTRTVYESCFE